MNRPPITPLGYGALGGMTVGFAIGYLLGWIEFVAIAAGFAVALVIALPFVIGGAGLALVRTVEPERVEVGKRASSVLSIINDGRSPSAPRTLVDCIAGKQRLLDVPGLARGASSQAVSALPTEHRGVVEVGPAIVSRSDPLGLLRRNLGQTGLSYLWVHPRVVPLSPLRSGFVKDLEGPTYDTSPAGDVAFHAIREYSPGDDVRHIHWMSTARTGALMVRHYVDNRRPYLGVLVDTDPEVMTSEAFERALEAAASQVVSATIDGRPLAVRVGSQEIVSSTAPADRSTALDRLCLSALAEGSVDHIAHYDGLRTTDQGVSALLFLTGNRSAHSLLGLTSMARKHGEVVVGRFVEAGAAPVGLPNARVFDCVDLDAFAAQWAVAVR